MTPADIDPTADRIIPPTPQFLGATVIVREGQTFYGMGVGPEVSARLERFAECSIKGLPLPEYPKRWPEIEP